MSTKILSVPYHSQHNNDRDSNSGPWNECSFTAMAMALRNVGIVGDGNGQLEDQIERSYESLQFDRGAPEQMTRWINLKYGHLGVVSTFTYRGKAVQIRAALNAGHVVIAHTDLTASGHVICIVGYDDAAYGGNGAWVAHDPWGEWTPTGYRTDKTGANVRYSYSLMSWAAGPDGNYWMHIVKRVSPNGNPRS